MSDIKHTQEPWKAVSNKFYWEIHGDTGQIGDVCASNFNGTNNGEANSRRIVACVNACAGIDTETLESISNHPTHIEQNSAFIAELDRVKAQRDELLAALKYHQEQTRPIQQTMDLIAKVQS